MRVTWISDRKRARHTFNYDLIRSPGKEIYRKTGNSKSENQISNNTQSKIPKANPKVLINLYEVWLFGFVGDLGFRN
jgi:hypothetical protein